MKYFAKLGGFLILISFFQLLFINPLYARSGCCSGHGGVNCSTGPQSNGKVICNDGWQGSSCLYSEMVMCGGNATTTTVQTIQPTSNPTLVPTKVIIPTKTPPPKPTSTPTTIPTSTLTPTITQTPTNTPPQVLGSTSTNSQPNSSSNPLGDLAIFAWVVYGIIKLIKRFKKSSDNKNCDKIN